MRSLLLLLVGILALGCDSNPPSEATPAPVGEAEVLVSEAPPEATNADGYDLATLEADYDWVCGLYVAAVNDHSRPFPARSEEALRILWSDPRGRRASAHLLSQVEQVQNRADRHDRIVEALREIGIEWSCPALAEYGRILDSGELDFDPSLPANDEAELARLCSIANTFAGRGPHGPGGLIQRVHVQAMKEIYSERVRASWFALRDLGPNERYPNLVASARRLGVESFDCPTLERALIEARGVGPQQSAAPVAPAPNAP